MLLALVMTVTDNPATADHHIPDRILVSRKDSRIQYMVTNFSRHARQVLVEHEEIGAVADLDFTNFTPQRTRPAGQRLLENNRADRGILNMFYQCPLAV